MTGTPSVDRMCDICSAHFLAWPYRVANNQARFCSRACKQTASRVGRRGPTVDRTCEICATPFRAWPSVVAVNRGRFCSDGCMRIASRQTLSWSIILDRSIPEPNSGCWLWEAALTGAGYGSLQVANKTMLAHRMAYCLHHGANYDDPFIIRHQCDNPACVNPDHLLAGTFADNSQDAVRRGRAAMGTKIWSAILTEADIPIIRAALAAGETKQHLAQRYGVHPDTIKNVRLGRTWKHL